MYRMRELVRAAATASAAGRDLTQSDIMLANSRLRFLTISGVLVPISGDRGAGKYRHKYDEDALFVAIICMRLIDAGLHTNRLGCVNALLTDPLWKHAKAGYHAWISIELPPGQARASLLADPRKIPPAAAPVLLLDLHQTFAGLANHGGAPDASDG